MLFVVGALLAGVAVAQTTTTDATPTVLTTTAIETTTEAVTTTVEQTTTQRIVVGTPTTPTTTADASGGSAGGVDGWVWVVIGIAAVALILVICLAVSHGHGPPGVPQSERRRRLDNTVATWGSQGWALMSQTGDSAVLQRGADQLLVTVDEVGHISTRPLQSSQP